MQTVGAPANILRVQRYFGFPAVGRSRQKTWAVLKTGMDHAPRRSAVSSNKIKVDSFMNIYIALKALHVLAAFALVGPLMLTPKWLSMASHEVGRSALRDLHRLTGIAGWIVLISGGIMLILQRGAMLLSFWMQFSVALFIVIQIFDHFWADRREEELELNPQISTLPLKAWLITKLGLYALIAILMVSMP